LPIFPAEEPIRGLLGLPFRIRLPLREITFNERKCIKHLSLLNSPAFSK
jgi:hypothetical protein